MNTWIVTGGVGCGKSVFCRLLTQMENGVLVFDSDECVHRLLTTSSIVRKIASAFGGGVVDENGGIIRSELRKLVFSDAVNRRIVEQIVHPAVFRELRRTILEAQTNGSTEIFVADIPLFFESKPSDLEADQVLVVGASRNVQVRRIGERSNGAIDPLLATHIVDAQLAIELKVERADRIIWNDGSKESLRRQASRILNLETVN